MLKSSVNILLVEDNPEDVELTVRAFKKHHLANSIVVLRDGEEAIDYIYARGNYTGRESIAQPRLMLLDLKLPKVDGIEVLRRLKDDEEKRSMPVVVLTSSTDERDLEECYRLGVNSYIRKPVDFREFTECVKNLGLYWLLLNELPEKDI